MIDISEKINLSFSYRKKSQNGINDEEIEEILQILRQSKSKGEREKGERRLSFDESSRFFCLKPRQSTFDFNLFNEVNLLFKDLSDNSFAEKQEKEEKPSYPYLSKNSKDTNDTSINLPNALIFEEDSSKKASSRFGGFDEQKEEEINYEFFAEDIIYSSTDKEDGRKSENGKNQEISLVKAIEETDPVDTPSNRIYLERILVLSKEQSSCRFLQQMIDEDPRLSSYFLRGILPKINDVITNQFGNYLIQNIISHADSKDIYLILDAIKENIIQIATNFYGTRVIQKMIDCINSKEIMMNLVDMLKKDFSLIVNDINSSHIIIKMLNKKENYLSESIYNLINDNIMTIAKHKHGCCAIQKILENPFKTEKIIKTLISNSVELITHQYGNYTIQYILQMKNKNLTYKLICTLIPFFTQLGTQKYSSTVLEKCFELCEENTKNMLYNVISNINTMQILICDKYGNYVIQKAIEAAQNETLKNYLLQIIANLANEIRKETMGKQLLTKLSTKYQRFHELITQFY